MDASRLHSVLEDVAYDYANNFKPLLAALIQLYTQARDTPAQDFGVKIDEAYKKLASDLRAARANQYPPSRGKILIAIGGGSFVGVGAVAEIDRILAISGRSAAGVVTSLTEYSKQVANFYKAASQAESGLQSLHVLPDRVPSGEAEIGILIPENLANHQLGGLAKQLTHWNRTLRGFVEVAGEDGPEVKVRNLASGSYEIYLGVGLTAAHLFSKVVDRVLGWYKQILELQELRKRIAALGAPVPETKLVEHHEKKLMDDAIATLVKELLADSKVRLSSDRRSEVSNQLTLSIKHVVKFVDQGGDVELTAGRPEVPEIPEEPETADLNAEPDRDYVAAKREYDRLEAEDIEATNLSRYGAALRGLPPRGAPILQLTDTDNDDGDAEETKQKKK